jgi:hypothetical protein
VIPRVTPEEAQRIMPLVIGRLFKIASRPSQPGDIDEYEKLRHVAMVCGEALETTPPYQLLPPGLVDRIAADRAELARRFPKK